jgi:hypothetical protein
MNAKKIIKLIYPSLKNNKRAIETLSKQIKRVKITKFKDTIFYKEFKNFKIIKNRYENPINILSLNNDIIYFEGFIKTSKNITTISFNYYKGEFFDVTFNNPNNKYFIINCYVSNEIQNYLKKGINPPFTSYTYQVDIGLDLIKPKAGEIVLFNGNGERSKHIKNITKSNYSHVGIIISHNKIFESNNNYEEYDNSIQGGVRLINFEKRINGYKGNIDILKLNKPLSEYQIRILKSVVKKYQGKPYETDPLNSVYSSKEDHNEFFCSELVCKCYKDIGLFDNYVNTNTMYPGHFYEYFINNITFENKFKFCELIKIK